MEALHPIIFKATEETLPVPDDVDQGRTFNNLEVVSATQKELNYVMRQHVKKRNEILDERREESVQAVLLEIKDKMGPMIEEAIAGSIEDMSNIRKAEYDKMIQKLLPALVEVVISKLSNSTPEIEVWVLFISVRGMPAKT